MTGFPATSVRRLPFQQSVPVPPDRDTGNIIVIPAYREPAVERTIESLKKCKVPHKGVEVFVIVNSSQKDTAETVLMNRKIFSRLEIFAETLKGHLRLFPFLYENLPAHLAGAGLARRLGMDEAARRFALCNNPDGVITSLDADTWVDPGYLKEIERTFEREAPDVATIYFEHPLSGKEFPDDVYKGIIQYELHLRYFVRVLRYLRYPWAFHTVGSAFAVKAQTYVKEGGMNLRQAGEDFYFLQKLYKSGKVSEIMSTCVFPSPRPSDRVPFGTGPEISRFLSGEKSEYKTYALRAFLDLEHFFRRTEKMYELPEKELRSLYPYFPGSIKTFLSEDEFLARILEIRSNVASGSAFVKRFYRWFDTFRVIKSLNDVHAGGMFEKQPVREEASRLLEKLKINPEKTELGLLEQFRLLDRKTDER